MEPFSLPPALVSPVNRVKQCLLNDDSKLESKLESTARFTYKRMQEKSRRECHAVLSDIYLNSSLPEPKETELLRAWIRILPAPGDDGLTEQERMQCIKQDELADVSEQEWKSFLFSCVKATVADAENAITAERSRFEKVTQELRQFGWSRSEDFPRFPSRTKTFSLALFLEDQIVSQAEHEHIGARVIPALRVLASSLGVELHDELLVWGTPQARAVLEDHGGFGRQEAKSSLRVNVLLLAGADSMELASMPGFVSSGASCIILDVERGGGGPSGAQQRRSASTAATKEAIREAVAHCGSVYPPPCVFIQEKETAGDQGTKEEYLSRVGNQIYKFAATLLLDAFRKRLPQFTPLSMTNECLAHAVFARDVMLSAVRREQLISQLVQHVESRLPSTPRLLVLQGKEGCGKTVLIASLIRALASTTLASDGMSRPFVLARFIGQTESSASLERLLTSLCEQLDFIFSEHAGDTALPTSIAALASCLNAKLRWADAAKPVVLLLDSLDDLLTEEPGYADLHPLHWLAHADLSPFVRVVISCRGPGPAEPKHQQATPSKKQLSEGAANGAGGPKAHGEQSLLSPTSVLGFVQRQLNMFEQGFLEGAAEEKDKSVFPFPPVSLLPIPCFTKREAFAAVSAWTSSRHLREDPISPSVQSATEEQSSIPSLERPPLFVSAKDRLVILYATKKTPLLLALALQTKLLNSLPSLSPPSTSSASSSSSSSSSSPSLESFSVPRTFRGVVAVFLDALERRHGLALVSACFSLLCISHPHGVSTGCIMALLKKNLLKASPAETAAGARKVSFLPTSVWLRLLEDAKPYVRAKQNYMVATYTLGHSGIREEAHKRYLSPSSTIDPSANPKNSSKELHSRLVDLILGQRVEGAGAAGQWDVVELHGRHSPAILSLATQTAPALPAAKPCELPQGPQSPPQPSHRLATATLLHHMLQAGKHLEAANIALNHDWCSLFLTCHGPFALINQLRTLQTALLRQGDMDTKISGQGAELDVEEKRPDEEDVVCVAWRSASEVAVLAEALEMSSTDLVAGARDLFQLLHHRLPTSFLAAKSERLSNSLLLKEAVQDSSPGGRLRWLTLLSGQTMRRAGSGYRRGFLRHISLSPPVLVAVSEGARWCMTGGKGTLVAWRVGSRADAAGAASPVSTGSVVRAGDDEIEVTCVHILANDQALVGVSTGELLVWDVATGREVGRMNNKMLGESESGLKLPPQPQNGDVVDSPMFLTEAGVGAQDGAKKALRSPRKVASHTAPITCIATSADYRTLVSGSQDRSLIIWSGASGKASFRLKRGPGQVGHAGPVSACCLDTQGKLLVSGDVGTQRERGRLMVWDAQQGTLLQRLEPEVFLGPIASLSGCGDLTRVVVVGENEPAVEVWNVREGKCLRTLRPLAADGRPVTGVVKAAHISTDGTKLVACCGSSAATSSFEVEDFWVSLHDVASGLRLARVYGGNSDLKCFSASPDLGFVLAGGSTPLFQGGRLTPRLSCDLFDFGRQSHPDRLQGHTCSVPHVSITSDGRLIASGDVSGKVIVWSAATRRPLGQVQAPEPSLWAVALAEDGTRLVVGGGICLHLWDLEDWLLVAEEEVGEGTAAARRRALVSAFAEEGAVQAATSSVDWLQSQDGESEGQASRVAAAGASFQPFPVGLSVAGRTEAACGVAVVGCKGGEVAVLRCMLETNTAQLFEENC